MKSKYLILGILAILIIGIILISSCAHQSSTQPYKNNEDKSLSSSEIETGNCIGMVNRDEIGGNNLSAGSIYGLSPVKPNGEFVTNVSDKGAQLIFVMEDGKNLRATAISLPNCTEKIIFDAKSTAKASIFSTPGILSTDPMEAKNRLNAIDKLSCFNELHSFLNNKLKTTPLGTIIQSSEYYSILQKCIAEMLEKVQK